MRRPLRLREEFLAHPLEAAPGCLIMDVSLPGLSGLELQKRAAAERPHIPTIFLSANDDIPTTVEAMKAGAVEFLTKPFRDIELVSAVREALERSRLVLARRAEKTSPPGMLCVSLIPRTAGDGAGVFRVDQQAGRRGARHQRNHGESTPWPGDAEDACRLFVDLIKMAGRLGLAKRREATMVCDHAACPGGQLLGSFAFVP